MKKLLALAALSAAVASPAWADHSYGSAETLGFGYDLIDLNNLDGITPTISFRYEGDAWQDYRIVGGGRPEAGAARDGYGTLNQSDLNSSVSLVSSADGVKAVAHSTWASVLAEGRASTTMTFSLTPHTAVIFHVPYALSVSTSALGCMATGTLSFSGSLDANYDSFSAQAAQRWTGLDSGSLTGELATGAEGLFGTVTLQSYVVAGVVPEPGPCAMLLAGLGVLALARRRMHNG